MALSGRSADRVARSFGRKADTPNQRVECPLLTQSGLSGPCSLNSERRRCLGAGCASRAARETRRGNKQSSELPEWRIQLLRAMASISRAKLVIRLVTAHMSNTGTPDPRR